MISDWTIYIVNLTDDGDLVEQVCIPCFKQRFPDAPGVDVLRQLYCSTGWQSPLIDQNTGAQPLLSVEMGEGDYCSECGLDPRTGKQPEE